MKYRPILGSLGYVLSPDEKSVLMVHRTARADDDHIGKYNGLGGKMEPREDAASCIIREIEEEAGIKATHVELRGTLNWTNFGPNAEDWMGFIFLIKAFNGTAWTKSPEGPLEWVALDKLFDLPMWEGDKHFLPLVFDNEPKPFHGYMDYEGENVKHWTYQR